MREIERINEKDILNAMNPNASWHADYKDSNWIFVGGLDFGLTEGDVLTVFSQYGQIEDINLVRERETKKSKGFSFLCYQNFLSTILAVDNLNGIKLVGRTLRVDHVKNYQQGKEGEKDKEGRKRIKLK